MIESLGNVENINSRSNLKITGTSQKWLWYFIGLIIITLCLFVILRQDKYHSLVNNLTMNEMIISFLLTFIVFLFNGLYIPYLIKKQYDKVISLPDYFLLPAMMHLWSYIIPFRGGLVFSTIYLKQKYKLRLSEGVSIGIYTFIFGLILTGMYGIYFSIRHSSLLLFFFSLFLLASPLSIYILQGLLKKSNSRKKVLARLIVFCNNITSNINSLFSDISTNLIVLAINLASLFFNIILFYFAASFLNMNLAFSQIVLISLITRLSIIFRVIPGNMGIQEIFSGSASALAGGDAADGIVIAIYVRLFSLAIALIFGILGVVINRKYLNIKSLFKI